MITTSTLMEAEAYSESLPAENYRCTFHKGITYEQAKYNGPVIQGKLGEGHGVYDDGQRSNAPRNLYPGDSTNYMLAVGIEGPGCVSGPKYSYGPRSNGGLFAVDPQHSSSVEKDNYGRNMHNEDYKNDYTHWEAYWIDTLSRYKTAFIETNENYAGTANGPAAFVDYDFTFNGEKQENPDPTAKYVDKDPSRSQNLIDACNDFLIDKMVDDGECVYGTINVPHRYYEGLTCDSRGDCNTGRGAIDYEFKYKKKSLVHTVCEGHCHRTVTRTITPEVDVTSRIAIKNPDIRVQTWTVPVLDVDGFAYNNMDGTFYPGDVIGMKYKISFDYMTRQHILFKVDELYNDANLTRIAGKQCFNPSCKLVIDSSESITKHLADQTFNLRYGEGISIYDVNKTHDPTISPFRHPVGVFNTLPENKITKPNSFAYNSDGSRSKNHDFLIPQWYTPTSAGYSYIGLDSENGANARLYNIEDDKLNTRDSYRLVDENGETYAPTGIINYGGDFLALLATDKDNIHIYQLLGAARGKYIYTIDVNIPGLNIGGMVADQKLIYLLDKNSDRIYVNEIFRYLYSGSPSFDLAPENSNPSGMYYDYDRNTIGVLDSVDKKIYVYRAGNPGGSTFGDHLMDDDIELDPKNANPILVLKRDSKIYVINNAGNNIEQFVGGLIHDTSRHPDRTVHLDLDVVDQNSMVTFVPFTVFDDDKQFPLENRLGVAMHYYGSINSHDLYNPDYYIIKHSILHKPMEAITWKGNYSNVTTLLQDVINTPQETLFRLVQKNATNFDGLDPIGVYDYDTIVDRQKYYLRGEIIQDEFAFDLHNFEKYEYYKERYNYIRTWAEDSILYEDRRLKITQLTHHPYGYNITSAFNTLGGNITSKWVDGGRYNVTLNNDTADPKYYGTIWETRTLSLYEAIPKHEINEKIFQMNSTCFDNYVETNIEFPKCNVSKEDAFDIINSTYYENPVTDVMRIDSHAEVLKDEIKRIADLNLNEIKRAPIASDLDNVLPGNEIYTKMHNNITNQILPHSNEAHHETLRQIRIDFDGQNEIDITEDTIAAWNENHRLLLEQAGLHLRNNSKTTTDGRLIIDGNVMQRVDETEGFLWGGAINSLNDTSFDSNGAMAIFLKEGYGTVTINHHMADFFFDRGNVTVYNEYLDMNKTYAIEKYTYNTPTSGFYIRTDTDISPHPIAYGVYQHPVAFQFVPVNVTSIDSEGMIKPMTINLMIMPREEIKEITPKRTNDAFNDTNTLEKHLENINDQITMIGDEIKITNDALHNDHQDKLSIEEINRDINKMREDYASYNNILLKHDIDDAKNNSFDDGLDFTIKEFVKNIKLAEYAFDRAFFETKDRGLSLIVANARNDVETNSTTHTGTIEDKARLLSIPQADLEEKHEEAFQTLLDLQEKGDPEYSGFLRGLSAYDGSDLCEGTATAFNPKDTINVVSDGLDWANRALWYNLQDNIMGAVGLVVPSIGAINNLEVDKIDIDIDTDEFKSLCGLQQHTSPDEASDTFMHPVLITITISGHPDLDLINATDQALLAELSPVMYFNDTEKGVYLKKEIYLPAPTGEGFDFIINTDRDNIIESQRIGSSINIPYDEKFGRIITINGVESNCQADCKVYTKYGGNMTVMNEWGGRGTLIIDHLPYILVENDENSEIPITPAYSIVVAAMLLPVLAVAYFYIKHKYGK